MKILVHPGHKEGMALASRNRRKAFSRSYTLTPALVLGLLAVWVSIRGLWRPSGGLATAGSTILYVAHAYSNNMRPTASAVGAIAAAPSRSLLEKRTIAIMTQVRRKRSLLSLSRDLSSGSQPRPAIINCFSRSSRCRGASHQPCRSLSRSWGCSRGGYSALGAEASSTSSSLTSSSSTSSSLLHRLGRGLVQVRKLAGRHFFLLGMVVAVGAARMQPDCGRDGTFPEQLLGRFGVALLFLLSGLSLESSQLATSLSNTKLNGMVQLASFGLWPLAGWSIRTGLRMLRPVVPGLDLCLPPALADGILAMTALPTTVNMCVLLTGACGGNVAAALCNAVLGNALGVVITPALLLRWFAGTSSSSAPQWARVPLSSVLTKLSVKVVLPVAAGQVMRNTPPAKLLRERHPNLLKRTQEVILLGIVWNAFCTSFSNQLGLDARQLVSLLLFLPFLHLGSLLLFLTVFSPRSFLRLSRADAVAAAFCSSHKTLAFGLPLLRTVFDGHPQLASLCAPVLLIHPIQLLVGSLLVPKLQRYTSAESPLNATVSS